MNYKRERCGGLERESYLNVITLRNICILRLFKETEVVPLLEVRDI
jgi:hypothetical protein